MPDDDTPDARAGMEAALHLAREGHDDPPSTDVQYAIIDLYAVTQDADGRDPTEDELDAVRAHVKEQGRRPSKDTIRKAVTGEGPPDVPGFAPGGSGSGSESDNPGLTFINDTFNNREE